MHTLLFDIDGTLIRSGGAGFAAMKIALAEIMGLESLPHVDVHGRTDRGILGDLFELVSLDYESNIEKFNRLYWEHLPASMQRSAGIVLPGVVELLTTLKGNSDIALGLLTGNAERAAQIKLQHFELDGFFGFGGYGDKHASRNDVAGLAKAAASEHLGEKFDPRKVWVIGDTVNDVVCGRSIDSKVIAVETGGADRDALLSAQPDALLKDLGEVSQFTELLFSTT